MKGTTCMAAEAARHCTAALYSQQRHHATAYSDAVHSVSTNLCPPLCITLWTHSVDTMLILTAGHDWSSFNLTRQWRRHERADLYGSNDVAAGRPDLLLMAAQQLLQPLFIVQVSCLAVDASHVHSSASLLNLRTLAQSLCFCN